MADPLKVTKQVLHDHARPIVHLRRQFGKGRIGLVFGAGLSEPLGIPGWKKLNEMIAEDERVEGKDLLQPPIGEETIKGLLEKGSIYEVLKLICSGPEETIVTQRLSERFRKKQYSNQSPSSGKEMRFNADLEREWREVIRDNLYKEFGLTAEQIVEKHPYLVHYLQIIQATPLTVNYNLDDVIEQVLIKKVGSRSGLGYESITDIRIRPKRNRGVIYHPNGYIPKNEMEGWEDIVLVLSEDEFAGRMIETMTGQYASLLHHFSRNTCLLIGLSLKDSILKNMLRQSAVMSPGHYHYYVEYCREGKKPPESEQEAIRSANFRTYNLITFFLSDTELAALGGLITIGYDCRKQSLDDKPLRHLADEVGQELVYSFYIVGAVGAGKSTVVSHLRSLVTHDEWVETRLPELGLRWKGLETGTEEKEEKREKEKKKKRIDKWIANQFRDKNHLLSEETSGIIVCDRCPLDPLAFTPTREWKEKADFLLRNMFPGKSQATTTPGHVILLTDDPELLELRVRRTARQYRKEDLDEMQEILSHIYNMDRGVTVVDCRLQTLRDIMRRVSWIVHMEEPYRKAEIHERMVSVREGKYGPKDSAKT